MLTLSAIAVLKIQYNQRLEDIRVLKLEIRKLRRANNILNKSVANVGDLR
jgi:FtsZ-binding cell division protein ZapB